MFCPKCGQENAEGAKFCSRCGAALNDQIQQNERSSETSTGLSSNVSGLLCYVLGWISGIVFLVIEKKSNFVKFHAFQSIMTFGVLTVASLVLSWIPFIGGILSWIISILAFVLWIILMVQAATGRIWKLPGAGNWAERQVNKSS